jgi:hypothetical protein
MREKMGKFWLRSKGFNIEFKSSKEVQGFGFAVLKKGERKAATKIYSH